MRNRGEKSTNSGCCSVMPGSGNRGSGAEESGNVIFAKREHVQKDRSPEAVETPDAKAAVYEERKEVTKKALKKDSPLCSIDGNPSIPEVRVQPGKCSQGQSQVWKQFCA